MESDDPCLMHAPVVLLDDDKSGSGGFCYSDKLSKWKAVGVLGVCIDKAILYIDQY